MPRDLKESRIWKVASLDSGSPRYSSLFRALSLNALTYSMLEPSFLHLWRPVPFSWPSTFSATSGCAHPTDALALAGPLGLWLAVVLDVYQFLPGQVCPTISPVWPRCPTAAHAWCASCCPLLPPNSPKQFWFFLLSDQLCKSMNIFMKTNPITWADKCSWSAQPDMDISL